MNRTTRALLAIALLSLACLNGRASALSPQGSTPPVPAGAQAAPVAGAAATDEPQRGQATPRDAAYTFIVLARDGEWEAAARILERP